MPTSLDRSRVLIAWLMISALCLVAMPNALLAQSDTSAKKKVAPLSPKAASQSALPKASDRTKPSTEPKASAAPKAETKTSKPAAATEQDVASVEAVAEENKERVAAERFLSVLEKNPRRGTALDRIYGFHVERGTLDQWLQQYRDRTARQDTDGTAWMLLGLIEAHRGQDAAAVQAFQSAEKHLSENPLASFYLGQSLVMVGQPDLAAAAFERALEGKPAQADLLEIFQSLGRVYQRAQQSEKALEVWNRLEKLFPNDLRVQEQIAQTLVEEGQAALALPRFEALAAKTTKDLYRQSQFRIQVAEIKVRIGKAKEALADFEKLLEQLNPENWLYRDVRHKIDEVFLRTDDQAGLATYYESWIGKHPDDVDAMARLARILATQGRVPEAQTWLEKGLKLAPSRKELRMAIIDQLVYDQKFAEAVQQYELLDQREPNNPDTIRDWGRLILKDTKREDTERKQAAAALWKRLVAAKPQDPLVATQVADLFRHAEMSDEALALYKKAIELDPASPQYREYLGEYYHQLKRPADALATWRQIVDGKNRNAANLARLAEVLMGFGYLAEGTVALSEAVTLEAKDFDLRLRLARALNRGEKYEESLEHLKIAQTLVTNAEESEAVLQQQLSNYQAAEKLPSQIEGLENELKTDPKLANKWYLLARYYEADHKLPESLRAIKKAIELDPQSIPALAAMARIQESNNSVLDAAETNRKLAAVDRRYRTEYLTNVAKLEARLGRRVEALQAGRDLIAAAPGNPDSYEFFSQLCFQLGENTEGLEMLRRSVRVNPSDPKVVLGLASALAEQFKTAEAIELYWRAFEKSTEIDGKLDVITRLTELYLQTNHLDRLLDRLERERREDSQQHRVMTLCLAQAHQSAGDFGTARSELERMLTPDTRDTPLLQQLAKLAESEGEYTSAVKYQQQLNKLSPSKEHELQLAHYLAQSGDGDQASQIMVKVALDEKDPERLLKSVDGLLQREQTDQVLQITERLLRDQPRNWEYLYREGVALFAKQPDKATERFKQILALNLSDEDLGAMAKAQQKLAAGQRPAAAQRIATSRGMAIANNPMLNRFLQRSQAASMLRYVTGLETRYRYATSMFWSPSDYGSARLAAFAWMMGDAQRKGQLDVFLKTQRDAWEKSKTSSRAAWDWYYIQSLHTNPANLHEATKALVALPGSSADAQFLFLQSLANRGTQNQSQQVRRTGETPVDTTPPLPDDELQLVLAIYKKTMDDPQFESLAQSYYGASLVNIVSTELTRAKREAEAKQLYNDALVRAKTADQISIFMNKAASDGNMEQVLKLWDALEKLPQNATGITGQQYVTNIGSQTLPRLMAQRAEAKAHPDIIKLLDRHLQSELVRQRVEASSGKPKNKNYGNPYGSGQRPYYQIWTSKNNTDHSTFEFPTPNAHFDYSSILILRNAYVLYQQSDLSSDLVKHFETAANRAETSAADRLPWQLGLAYLHWWNDAQDMALKELQEISLALPEDLGFKLELAELYGSRNDFADSLQLLDSITPLDQEVMQRRETLALRMAIQLGETERAREAAARLFGLRLDAETQIQLASQMKQLGMHEQAEAVMARAGRQAGNRMGALISLMREFQAQGKTDTALQIAQTILRRTQARGPVSRNSSQDANSSYRQQAVQFLVDSGKLKDLIERTEAQLKNAPKSIQLHQTLAEFYTAAGNKEKAKEFAIKLAELNQNDPVARWNIAKQLLQAGETDAAIEHLKVALKQRPQLFANEYWEVQNAFRRAKKTADLVKILDEIDLKQMGQYYVVSNIVQELIREEASRKSALQLLKRAWEAFPNERVYLLGSIYDDEVWKLPELYEYSRQAFVPQDGQGPADPWAGFDIRSYSGDGTVRGSLHHLLIAAKAQNKLPALEKEIIAALEKSPQWRGGQAMLAIIQVQRGDHQTALKAFQDILTNKEKGLSGSAAWLIAQELKAIPKTDALAIQFYEYAVADPNTGMNNQFQYTPGSALVSIYEKAGQKDKAREMLLKAVAKSPDTRYDPQYQAYQRIQTQYEIAEWLRKMGFAIDSIKIFNRLLLDKAGMETARNYGGQEYSAQARKGLETALASIDATQLTTGVQALLQPIENSSQDPQAPAVDLFLTLSGAEGKVERINSLLATILQKVAKEPALQAEVNASLQKMQAERPDDLSIRVLGTMLAAHDAQPEALTKSATELDQWVAGHPLEEIADVKRANSRQREAAARRIPLWLAARECLKREPLHEVGNRLSTQALEGARRQADNGYLLAMVREAGQLAWDTGDTKTAEARWSEMLDLILTRPGGTPNPSGSRLPPPTASPAVPATVVGAPPPTPAGRKNSLAPPATLSQFNQILEIARLAEERSLHALSFKAIRTVFRGGPPIEVDPNLMGGRPGMIVRSSSSRPGSNAIETTVANGIWDLQKIWAKQKAPDDEVYAVLSEIVFAESRPDELMVYPRPLPGGDNPEGRSVGLLLVRQAVAAQKTDELRERLNKLTKVPRSEFHAHLLLSMLAIEVKDIPRIKVEFAELAKLAERNQTQSASELVCHVALPAVDNEELAESAHPLLMLAIKHLKSTNRNDTDRSNSLILRLSRLEFKRGNYDSGKQLLDDYLKAQDALYQDYGGDYGQYMHKRTLQMVAAEFAKAGRLEDAMQKLGEAADMPKFENYGSADDGIATAAVLKQLKTKSADEQYKILKTWTLPATGRQTIRMMAKFGPQDSPPEIFVKGLLQLGQIGRPQGVESSAKLLVQAATEVNKLDQLEAEVQPLVDQKLDRARELLALIRLAQKKAKAVEPDIKVMLQETREKMPKSGERVDAPWPKFLVAREALFDPEVRLLGQELASELMMFTKTTQNHQMLADLRYHHSRSLMLNNPGTKHAGGTDPGLKWWRGSVEQTSWIHAAGNAPSWWLSHAGMVAHICGPDTQCLYFRYPLTGTFEFNVDAFCGGWGEGNVGYGGLLLVGAFNGGQTQVSPHGLSETLYRPAGPKIPDQFNRHTIQVQAGKMRYLVNKTLLYEDTDLGSNGPWLVLHTGRAQRTAFKNFRIAGQPVVPREVRLVEGDRLEGWVSNFYSESQPARRTIGQPSRQDGSEPVTRNPDINVYDWAAQDGVIHGRKLDLAISARPQPQSRLYYHRPLEDGDTLSYEFLFEPGATHVHPALDRLTFLLEPTGVRLHWITDGLADQASELHPENVIDQPGERRGPAALPLLPGQWNTMRVSLQLPTVRLELNGQLVYEAELEPTNNRQFGLFHYKNQTAVKVRNALLTGNWPEQLSPEMLSNPIAPDDTPLTPADRHARHAIIGENLYLLGVRDVLQKAQILPDAERYAFLKDWVLPTEDHPTYRLIGDFTPVDQPSLTKQPKAALDPAGLPEPTSHTGGELRAPAFELIAAAKATNQLSELKRLIESLPNQRPEDKRCKLALLALIHMSESKWNVADAQLASLFAAQKELGPEASAVDRWPDLLAAVEAARYPETRFESGRLLEEAVNQSIRRNPIDDWDHLVRTLRDQARWLVEQDAWNASKINYPTPKQWIPGSAVSARQRGAGITPGKWLSSPGELRHFAGRTEDLIYFQSPLRGDFEMECELSFLGWRELNVLYGGQYNSPLYTLNEVRLGRISGQLSNGQLEQPLKPLGQAFDYKLIVKDGVISAFVNGEKIHERRLPVDFDPWLAIHSPSRNSGTVRQVRITGTPSIPKELDLLAVDHLGEAWRGDYYNQNEMLWRKDGEELTSDKIPNLSGRKQQTLVQYHRPLAEDSELDYEFYYDAGSAAVHPALDRLAMLVESDGVNVHWLTDLQFDQSSLEPGNVTTEKDNRRGPQKLPLKAKDWNQARLKLIGNVVTLAVNGVEVYQRELDSTNNRTFGLFHFADETQARVRNVRYRGNWPLTLPPLGAQELAVSPATRAAFAKPDLPHEIVWNSQSSANAKPQFRIVGETAFVTPTPDGLKTMLPAGREKPSMVGVSLTTALTGDFEIVGTFSGLKSHRPEKDPQQQGPGLDLSLYQGGPHQQWVKLERKINAQLQPVLQPVHGQVGSGNRQFWQAPHFIFVADGQRLKIVRRGAIAYYLVAAHDSHDYRLLEQRNVGTQPVEKVEFLTRAFGKEQGSEAVLEELIIRSQHPLELSK